MRSRGGAGIAVMKHAAGFEADAKADLLALQGDADRVMPHKPIGIEIATNLAMVLESIGDHEAAIAAYRDALQRSTTIEGVAPETTDARASLGELLVDLGKAREALPELEAAIKIFDEKENLDGRGRYRVALARALWLLGRKPEAKTVAATARTLLGQAGEGSKDALDELDEWEHERR